MNNATKAVAEDGKSCSNSRTRYSIALFTSSLVLLLFFGAGRAQAEGPRVVRSKDGTPISYEVHGRGEPTLVFVHGWSCDARYWRKQVPHFSKKHRVVLVDLAGHGHSGSTRTNYTMQAFGEDVRAVAEAVDGHRLILIGHSMGGPVIAEAARLMPNRTVGLVGIDTLHNVEYPMTPEARDQMIAPLKREFQTGCRQFVGSMFVPGTDPLLRDWILSDMSAAPPAVAVSAMEEMTSQYVERQMAKTFDDVRLPIVAVNADMWPIDYEANRRHMLSFEAIVLNKTDHFLMLTRADDFNKALEQAIGKVLQKGTHR